MTNKMRYHLGFLSAMFLAVLAGTCQFNRRSDICPAEGFPCTEKVLCQPGLYCRVEEFGEDGSYFGRCASGPTIDSVYNKPCDIGTDFRSCQYHDKLALNPYEVPKHLRCIKSPYADRVGNCLLGPQKHGDGCNQNGECASGKCLTELRICKGLEAGEACVPGMPDPCMPNHYCAPDAQSIKGGRCKKSVSAGKACNFSTACERGTFCAGHNSTARTCMPVFSVPDNQLVDIGPYMCQSGTAIVASTNLEGSNIFKCVARNASYVGEVCESTNSASLPLGYECVCAADNQERLRTIGGVGIGYRSKAFEELFECLMTAINPMGDLCGFDAADLEQVRYGSCGFYACYGKYQQLVNTTGGRFFTPPLDVFEPISSCEHIAATKYYETVASTPCIQIPHMDNWKCKSNTGPLSLSVQNTWGVLVSIFILVCGGYVYHMYYFRRENRTKIPFLS